MKLEQNDIILAKQQAVTFLSSNGNWDVNTFFVAYKETAVRFYLANLEIDNLLKTPESNVLPANIVEKPQKQPLKDEKVTATADKVKWDKCPGCGGYIPLGWTTHKKCGWKQQ